MILRGLFWDFLGKILSQGLSFIASIFLARILLPEDFGLVAIAVVFIHLSQVFIDAGFGAALIQKKEVSERLYSTVFWLNVTSGLILAVLFIFISNWVATIYEKPNLTPILQYFSLAFIINSLGVIQRVQLTKKMDFKRLSLIAAISTFLSGAIAIYIAYQTKSYWALVVQQLCLFGFNTLLLWILNSWKPKLYFSFKTLKSVWGFSSRKFADGILTSIVNSTDTILIGKIFPTHSLGLYSRAKNLSEMVRSYGSGGVSSVLFPAISKIQDQKNRVEQTFLKMNASIAVFSVGLALILFMFAKPLILLLYSAKWSGSIFFFQILIISSFLHPLSAISQSTLNGLGYIKITFNYGLIKKALRLLGFLIALRFGIEAFAYSISINFFIIFFMNSIAIKKKTTIGFKDILSPVTLNVLLASIVYFICWGFELLIDSSGILFYLTQFILTISIYILFQYTFNKSIFSYWIQKIKEKLSQVFKRKGEENN